MVAGSSPAGPKKDMDSLQYNKKELTSLKRKINKHPLFKNNLNKNEVKLFMETHVFAVWGFMSLLKKIQKKITPQNIPWVPNENTKNGLANFVNEIILGEESDYIDGIGYISHFEIYLLAMKNIDANPNELMKFIKLNKKSNKISTNLQKINVCKEVKDFLKHDLKIASSGSLSQLVGVFTLGREKVIPNMFKYILQSLNDDVKIKYLRAYLERHISVDGERHGPLSVSLLNNVCHNPNLMCEAYKSAITSLELRLKVWDKVYAQIRFENV